MIHVTRDIFGTVKKMSNAARNPRAPFAANFLDPFRGRLRLNYKFVSPVRFLVPPSFFNVYDPKSRCAFYICSYRKIVTVGTKVVRCMIFCSIRISLSFNIIWNYSVSNRYIHQDPYVPLPVYTSVTNGRYNTATRDRIRSASDWFPC